MSFRLVPKSVTLNDLERRNGVILRCFSELAFAISSTDEFLLYCVLLCVVTMRRFVTQ